MQSLPYFFAKDITGYNKQYTLNEDASRHCIQVLRMKEGERLNITDGMGNLITAAIVTADKKACIVFIEQAVFAPRRERKISVAISLLKNAARFEWFLEKAAELGVYEIIPLLCHRTERQHFRYERMQGLLVAAMLQSQQCWLPLLQKPAAFEGVVTSSVYAEKLIAHCEDYEKGTLLKVINNEAQILIGPEGDFVKEEINIALNNGYKPVSLGDTRLRTETAGVVASALLLHIS